MDIKHALMWYFATKPMVTLVKVGSQKFSLAVRPHCVLEETPRIRNSLKTGPESLRDLPWEQETAEIDTFLA